MRTDEAIKNACSNQRFIGRFWSLVDKASSESECWNWTGRTKVFGVAKVPYGYIQDRAYMCRADLRVHRVAYCIVNGPIATGLVVRHSCDNTLCCNPKHLLAGTNAENSADMVSRNRQARGSRHGSARLSESDVLAIRSIPRTTSIATIASEYGVHEATIHNILAKRTWKHLG